MKLFAVCLVWMGLLVLCAGVWVLAGVGWTCVVAGLVLAATGLAAIDVDGKTKGAKS